MSSFLRFWSNFDISLIFEEHNFFNITAFIAEKPLHLKQIVGNN